MDQYQETFETWNKMAQLYEDKFMNLDLYNDTYSTFCELIDSSNTSILEIGCGPGNITKYLLGRNQEFIIKAIDISEKMIKLAQKNNPNAEFEVMDCRDIHTIKSKFDAIVCGFSIPYISQSECSKLIADCNTLINEKGVLYISFVAGDYQNSGYKTGSSGDRVYFYYHNLEDIKKDLKINSFNIFKLIEKKFSKSDGTDEIHTILIAKK